jgi:hypothetical protein
MFSVVTDFLYAHWWKVLLYLLIVGVLYYLAQPKTYEGFTSSSLGKMQVCPVIKSTIDRNQSFIEGFTEKGEVSSLARTNKLIEALSAQYANMGCEDVASTELFSIPADQPMTVDEVQKQQAKEASRE